MDRTPFEDRSFAHQASWKGVLKVVDELIELLPDAAGGTSRTAGTFSQTDIGRTQAKLYATRAEYSHGQADGTSLKYEIEIRVVERVDSRDEYWGQQIEDRENALVINGVHYRIGDRSGIPGPFKGFGGRKFAFRWKGDDEVIEVDDLWYQGPIPPKFRELAEFQDNAEWVDPEQEPFRR